MPRRAKAKPEDRTDGQVEPLYPATAQWVPGNGHIEIGDQDSFGFVVRALNYGGLILEDDRPRTLAESMATLEAALARRLEDKRNWNCGVPHVPRSARDIQPVSVVERLMKDVAELKRENAQDAE